ncbi:MAG TPA: thioredoxin [Bacteroidales bacterium]|nr:thioredoxin [Bacteroidales bacterium]
MKAIKITILLILAFITVFGQQGCSADEKKQKPESGNDVTDTVTKADENKSGNDSLVNETESSDVQSKPIKINTDQFKKLVFNYDENPDKWVFEGDMPTIIDFYADWCKPCKMIAPTLEKLQEKYKGKIRVYKINTDENPGLSQYFQIQGIPALLFIPMEGQPQMASGALPEADFEKAIKEVMKVQ